MVSMFSGYCEQPFMIEPVEVIYEQHDKSLKAISGPTPVMFEPKMDVQLKDINGLIGIEVDIEKVMELLKKMQLNSQLHETKEDTITVTIPITRSDILHPVDIIEDVAIAYGINLIVI